MVMVERHQVKFRLLNESVGVYTKKTSLLLIAFNMSTKYNGFYKKSLDENGDPKLLTMGPWHHFYRTNTQTGVNMTTKPQKAISAN